MGKMEHNQQPEDKGSLSLPLRLSWCEYRSVGVPTELSQPTPGFLAAAMAHWVVIHAQWANSL